MREEQKEESVYLSNEKKRNVFKAEAMRLTNPKDFKKCFQAGKRTNNKVFSLYYIENGGLPGRLGVNVAKSKINKAVDRNKIKRVSLVFGKYLIHKLIKYYLNEKKY